MGKLKRFWMVVVIMGLFLPFVTASSLSIDHNNALINETLILNSSFTGGFEGERLVNWSKNGAAQGYIIPPMVSKWAALRGWQDGVTIYPDSFNTSHIFDIAGADNGNDGGLQNFESAIAVYHLDDSGVSTAIDSSGNGYDGTVVGATFTNGINGTLGYLFDGTAYIKIGEDKNFSTVCDNGCSFSQ